MKTFSVRLDRQMTEIIDRNAAEQGTKPTRYIRSLIEKGLVMDHQIRSGSPDKNMPIQEQTLWLKLAELLVENVLLTRKLVRHSVATSEEHQALLQMVAEKAQQYIEDTKMNTNGLTIQKNLSNRPDITAV